MNQTSQTDPVRHSMTFGELPSYPMFKKHWDAYVFWPAYVITKHKHEGQYTLHELYELVVKLRFQWDNGDEEAGNDASSILETLGIEWV